MHKAAVGKFMVMAFVIVFVLASSAQNTQATSQVLKVGFDKNYPPLQFLNSKGEPDGYDIELLRLIADKADLNLEFISGSWYEINAKLSTGEIDIIPGMYINPGRQDDVIFSIPTLITAHEFFSLESSEINSLNDIRIRKDIRIIIQNVKVLKDYIYTVNPDAELIFVENALEGFNKLSLGYGDCLFLPDMISSYYFASFPAKNIRKSGIKLLYREYAIAANANSGDLIEKINAGLDLLGKEDTYVKLQSKWIDDKSSKNNRRFQYLFLISLVVLVLVIFLGLLWGWTLRVNVRKKTFLLNRQLIEKSQTEQLLIIEKQKAEEADRLKSAFLANMSHEIRTPMNAIIGFGELLYDKNLSEEDHQKYINHINANGQVLLNLINDIIDVSKIEAQQLSIISSPFELIRALKEIVVVVEQQIKKKHKDAVVFNAEFIEDDFWMISDEVRFKQIFYNLLSNANKFTSSGSISFGYTMINDRLLRFYVKDTGIGIPQNKLDVIFNRFRQIDEGTNRAFDGSGLGLYITKTLVELLGGKISVESEPGKGSTFIVDLPSGDNFEQPESQNNLS